MNLRGLGLCGKLGPVLRTPRLPSPTDTPSAQSYGHPVCPVLRTPRLPSPTDTPSAQSYGHPVCPVLRTPQQPSTLAGIPLSMKENVFVPTPYLPPFVLLVGLRQHGAAWFCTSLEKAAVGRDHSGV